MVIRDIYHEVRELLGNAREAEMIVSDVLALSKLDFMLKSAEPVAPQKLDIIRSYAKRRMQHEPLQYILGTQEFMSLKFLVRPGVLIPRSDTETLVETVLKRCQGRTTILDVGTGSGCIPISIAYYNPNVQVTTVDISDTAIETARENIIKNGVSGRVRVKKCDIMKEQPKGCFDLIVSNPPYIETDVIPALDIDVKDYEPLTALDGGGDGLDFYRRIILLAPALLQPRGELWFEVGFDQAARVCRLMEPYFEEIQKVNDLCGVERVVGGVLKTS